MTRSFAAFSMLLCLMALTACTTVKQSNPARTATEEMLISTAADRAAQKIAPQIPANARVYVDASYFEGTDSKYAIGAIRSHLVQQGIALTDDRKSAAIIIEIRSGALSTDEKQTLVGIPSFNLPIPFASSPLATPEIALYSSDRQQGVAKFAATVYNAKSWGVVGTQQDPQYGFSQHTKKTLLIFFSWDENDAVPKEDDLTSHDVRLSDESTQPAAAAQ